MKKRPKEGDIYREINIFDTYGSKKLNCEINFHTLAGGSVIFDKCNTCQHLCNTCQSITLVKVHARVGWGGVGHVGVGWGGVGHVGVGWGGVCHAGLGWGGWVM